MPPQRGVRDRGRGRRIGREQGRGEGRGRSGMGGHGGGCNEIDNTEVLPPNLSLQIKRKTVLDVAGNVRRWWFVIHASEKVLLDLEGRWDQLQFQTGWKLEQCFKTVDPVTSNVDPQTSLDANVVTPALDCDTNQASPESLQDHDNNQASLESCQTSPFLGN